MEDESEVYSTLPEHVQRKIDKAFYDATHPTNGKRKSKRQYRPRSHTKKRKVDSGEEFIKDDRDEASAFVGSGGGFIVDDAPAPSTSGGGGLVDDDDDDDYDDNNQNDEDDRQQDKSEYISLSTIPSALQLLGLSPDDAQVMGVFRRAAADWDEVDRTGDANPHGEAGEGLVSLKDWRAVCGVLLEGADVSEGPEASGPLDLGDFEDPDPSDEYAGDSGDDSDEYIEGGELPRRCLRRNRGTTNIRGDSGSSFSSDDDSPITKPLTSKQRQTCLQTFALFLDSSANTNIEELSTQRLRISDIQRVAGLLKEKLKAEEMVEMLETFSTSPDKSMSLEDFERMMVRAKLV